MSVNDDACPTARRCSAELVTGASPDASRAAYAGLKTGKCPPRAGEHHQRRRSLAAGDRFTRSFAGCDLPLIVPVLMLLQELGQTGMHGNVRIGADPLH